MTMQLDFTTTAHVFNPFLLTSALIPKPRAAFCQWFEDFGRRLAPADLGNVPLYCVDAALSGPGQTMGLGGEDVDLAYRRQIGHRWKGRGACLALDLEQVADNAAREEGNEEAHKAVFVRHAIGLALHELGHALQRPRLFNPDSDQAQMEKALRCCIETPGEELPDCDVAWSGHDGQFLRVLAHVEYRAKLLLGFPVEAYSFAGLAYRLSPPAAYRQAIADEPKELAGEPLTAVRATCPPRPFIELWRGDVERWFQPLALPSRFQIAAREAALSLFQE